MLLPDLILSCSNAKAKAYTKIKHKSQHKHFAKCCIHLVSGIK